MEQRKSSSTPLILAAGASNLEVVKMLLEAGCSCNKRDETQQTVLHRAASLENLTIVEELLNRGAEIDAVRDDGATALSLALEAGNLQVIWALLKRNPDPNICAKPRKSPLYLACELATTPVVWRLVELGAIPTVAGGPFGTPLHLAVLRGELGCISLLARDDSHDCMVRPFGTPLHTLYAMAGYTHRENLIQTSNLLLDKGANIDRQDYWGRAPLILALLQDWIPIDHLLTRGARLDIRDGISATALHYAAQLRRFEEVKQLRLNAASVECVDDGGRNPL
ncbi:ankyrin, partial [Aspergillus uvarum CBS 121591]